LGWAQAGNTPFQYYKRNTHNGGVRVPLIMHWPEEIKNKGEICNQYHHAVDITPTVLDILNIEAPESYRGYSQIPMQGISMANTFNNSQTEVRRETQYYSTSGNRG